MTTDQATATDAIGADESEAPPRLTGPQPLTDALIDAVANGHCGWSRNQIEILGASWPLEAGWREMLVAEGRTLSAEEVEALYDARETPKRPTEPNPAEIVELPCPWCSRMVQRVEQGGHTREFCSRKHKTLFNTALTKASIEHPRLLRTPGALRSWVEARVHPSQNTESGPSRTPQQDTPSEALDDGLPF